jgi:hypothetical protein
VVAMRVVEEAVMAIRVVKEALVEEVGDAASV